MSKDGAIVSTRLPLEGPNRWPWLVGLARIGMLAIIAAGTYLLADRKSPGISWLPLFLVFGLAASLYYQFGCADRDPSRALTWAQFSSIRRRGRDGQLHG